MVGNDVVDLGDPDAASATLHPRFDARVFDEAERSWLHSADGSARLWRWRLWAAKEASFKVAKRRDASTVWAPRRFTVEPGGEGARVLHGPVEYSVQWVESGDWVHAVAWRADAVPSRPLVGVAERHELPASAAVRDYTCAEVARALDRRAGSLNVRTEDRIPNLDGVGTPLPLSLSHHGRFVAFACALPSDPEWRGDLEAAA